MDRHSIASWTREVAAEWRWLFRASNITSIANQEEFDSKVLGSSDFYIVGFLDGLDCGSCKTAKTNMMRLSASLREYTGVSIAIVDCEDAGIVALHCSALISSSIWIS